MFSGASNAQQLQNFVESNIFHRQGYVYGAKDNKRLQLFIDDVNLPTADAHGVQRVNELLRRLLDDRVICTLQKPYEWRNVEGLSVVSAMSMSDYATVRSRGMHSRLMVNTCTTQLCLHELEFESYKS